MSTGAVVAVVAAFVVVGTVMMRWEAYPDLKASESALALQGELANTEDLIAAAPRAEV